MPVGVFVVVVVVVVVVRSAPLLVSPEVVVRVLWLLVATVSAADVSAIEADEIRLRLTAADLT